MRASTVVSSVLSLALLANQAVATPPACLLACVAQVTKASSTCDALNDVNCICSKQGDDVKKCLDSICPNGDAEAAYSAFKSSCSEQNVSVDNKHSSSSSKASSSAAKTSSSVAKTSSTEVAASSSEVAKTSSSEAAASSTQAAASSTKVEVTSTVSSKVEVSSTSSTTLATSSKVEEVSSSSSTSSTLTVSEIHSDAGNYLQAGNTFAIAAIAALLI